MFRPAPTLFSFQRMLVVTLRSFFSLLLLLVTLGGCESARRVPPQWEHPLDIPVAEGEHGMVASTAQSATRVGVAVLRSGGTAVDATIATAFALAVVHPSAGNIGGGGFLIARIGDSMSVALDFREKAPRAAHRNMYLTPRGDLNGSSTLGHLAAGVPGCVRGLWEFHKKFGTRPWAELIAPAIRLAREGFTVDQRLHESISADSARFVDYPGSSALFLPDGRPPEIGVLWKNPDLAAILERIAKRGPDGFYTGATADLIVAEMRRGGGLITHQDLKEYVAVWRDPIVFSYRGHTIFSMPPPSSGGITMAMIGNILEGYDLKAAGWHSAESMHFLAEAMRRAYADRNFYLGDPEYVAIPTAMLLSKEYAARRRMTILPDRATPSSEVLPGSGSLTLEHPQTTHFSVADDRGNAVAMTTTLNLAYGSAVTVTGAGFLLNNEMDDFAAKPGAPNVYGLVQGEANAIAPGKRMLSSMTPTIVLDPNGAVVIVTGAAGGPRIITSVFQVISNLIDYHLPLSAAMNGPRIHQQHLPDRIGCERHGFDRSTLDRLRSMGYTIKEEENESSVTTIVRAQNLWQGMAEPRGEGSAEGL